MLGPGERWHTEVRVPLPKDGQAPMHLLTWKGAPWALTQQIDACNYLSSRDILPVQQVPHLARDSVFRLLILLGRLGCH